MLNMVLELRTHETWLRPYDTLCIFSIFERVMATFKRKVYSLKNIYKIFITNIYNVSLSKFTEVVILSYILKKKTQ